MSRSKGNGEWHVAWALWILVGAVVLTWFNLVGGTYLRFRFGHTPGPTMGQAGWAFGIYTAGALTPGMIGIFSWLRRRKAADHGRPSVQLGRLSLLLVTVWAITSSFWIADVVYRVEYRRPPTTVEERAGIGLPPRGQKPEREPSDWDTSLPNQVSFICTVTGWLLSLGLCFDLVNVSPQGTTRKRS